MFARVAYALSALLVGVSALAGIQFSSAEWTDQSDSPVSISSAPDWTPPMVAVTDPGYALWGTVTIGATANDATSAIASVQIQYRPDASSTWTSICPTPDTTSPYSCSWNTTAVTDGIYHLRAIAVDAEGNSQTSAEVSSEVRNTAGVVIDPVASPTKGVVVLTGRVVNAGSGATTVNFQYSVANNGNGPWSNIPGCVALPGPEGTCSFNTAPTSGTFDMRAVGTANGQTYYAVQKNIVVDNTAPVVSLTVPAGPLSGTIDLTATASDANTSVASVVFEHRPAGGTWTSCPADTTAPYSCTVATTGLSDGTHEFRATGTDTVGNSTTTATVTRVVDNNAPTVSLTVPAGPLTGQIDLTATASDAGSGVAQVQFQYQLQGAPSWSNCEPADTSSPYACQFNATAVTNGTYLFRAVATDGAGLSTTTATQSRVVQNLFIDLADLPYAVGLTTPITLSATWSSSSTSVKFEFRATGSTGAWTTVTGCTAVTANPTATCSWALPANGSYDVRASTVFGGSTYTDATATIVDKTAPSAASITVPAAPLNGVVTLSATGTDAQSGIQSAVFEYQLQGAGTWTTCGTDTTAPYTCDVDTSTLTDANYDFRVTVYDYAGWSRTTGATRRAVDSVTATVAVTSPTAGSTVLAGTNGSVTASASSNKPITSVALQYRRSGTTTWLTICTDTSAPYACTWDSSSLASGTFEMQAVLTKSNGNLVTSATVTFTLDRFQGSSVDATPAEGQAVNTAPSVGDTIRLTYSGPVNLSTIKSGFTGAMTPIAVTLNGKNVTAGQAVAGAEWLAFPDANLGQVAVSVDHITASATTTFVGSMMTASTTGGVTTVVVTLGTPVAVLSLKGNSTMTWTPSSAAQHTDGRACSTVAVVETGAGDKDL